MRILFQGYYGKQNTGDDAFVEVAAWGAKKYWNCNLVTFFAEKIPNIIYPANYTGKNLFRGHKHYKAFNAIINSNAFIMAGGSTFHSVYNIFNPKKMAAFKKKFLKKYIIGAIGVSLGPYKSKQAEKNNLEFLKQLDFLALRDNKSYELAKSYDLPYSPIKAFDLAALLPKIYNCNFQDYGNNSKIVGVSMCNYESYVYNGDISNEERRNDRLEKIISEVIKADPNIKFRFFIFNNNAKVGDNKITYNLINKLTIQGFNNFEIVKYSSDIYHTWNKIRECSIMISVRLHAAVFACFANIPFYLIEYHRKCTDFLDTIGYNDLRLFDAECEVKKVSMRILDVLYDSTNFNKPLFVSDANKLAEQNFTETKEYFA
ncbi:hypothetical protein Flexsi_0357 [Flexistipes sinusarabici DSM 4947]|uniref:Polysaccharide pyruvyl transferase domain-containing protein n=1 Tax=Flexistipes sinusarabici (strain ATCC 49648 / DSM 4947 / MAS 10) TaxID=717231 RepID=F8E8J6_FLESM|nr:polysaccharide pyruvyl transferase family protein [Flexistipes sinusarabici]AEI14045.1 hypothetical protein Flexsi_0357 [Flexistipes sinusarabici DSM 4947]